MSDLISRQWLMECIDEGWIRFDTEKDANTYIHLIRDIAPSAQPERKTGKWIKDFTELLGYKCSVCGKGSCKFNFCPNCGAMMKEGE